MKTAIAYVADIILGRTGDIISRQYQKELIEKHAASKGIKITAWFEDEMFNEDVMSRPGVQAMLAYKGEYDALMVERVWSLSRSWSTCQRFFEVLDKRQVKLEAATTMWDCVSQMSRRHFDATLKTPKLSVEKQIVYREETQPVKVAKPKRLFFTFQPQTVGAK